MIGVGSRGNSGGPLVHVNPEDLYRARVIHNNEQKYGHTDVVDVHT